MKTLKQMDCVERNEGPGSNAGPSHEKLVDSGYASDFGRNGFHDLDSRLDHPFIPKDYANCVLDSERSRESIGLGDLAMVACSRLFALAPIKKNIAAIGVSSVVGFILYGFLRKVGLSQYFDYFAVGIQIVDALNIIGSSRRSLLLPISSLTIGSVVSQLLPAKHTLFHFGRLFYFGFVIDGLIGVALFVIWIASLRSEELMSRRRDDASDFLRSRGG